MHFITLLTAITAFSATALAGPSPCLTPGACKTAPKNTPANIKFIQFPESYNEVVSPGQSPFSHYDADREGGRQMKGATGLYHGFTYAWRKKCEGKCGDSGGHHFMSVVPTRAANIASASCWCCIKNPATGNCYDKTQPYSATSVVGPYTLMTDICIAKMSPAVKEIGESAVTSVPVPALTIATKKPAAGKSVLLRWKAPTSELIDASLYAKFTAGTKTATVLLNKKTFDCIIPIEIYGNAVDITVYSGKTYTPVFEVAKGTFKIAKAAAEVKRSHGDVLRRL